MNIKDKDKDGYFGEMAFFSDQERTSSVRSDGFSNLFFIRRSEFIKIIKKFPLDHEKFQMI